MPFQHIFSYTTVANYPEVVHGVITIVKPFLSLPDGAHVNVSNQRYLNIAVQSNKELNFADQSNQVFYVATGMIGQFKTPTLH